MSTNREAPQFRQDLTQLKAYAETLPIKFSSQISPTLIENLNLGTANPLSKVLEIHRQICENSISTYSPFFMNQLFASISPHSAMAETVIHQTKTTLATHEASPVFTQIEQIVVRALGELIGWSKESVTGISVPGGSLANFMALHFARMQHAPHIKTSGMNHTRFRIFTSVDAHYSLKKACAVLGFGSDSLISVPIDSEHRMDTKQLAYLIEQELQKGNIPLMVNATAGTTVYGAFDPFAQIAEICKHHGMWLHIDGAWGGPALFSQHLRSLITGISLADSFSLDTHKLLGLRMTCSVLLSRHKSIYLAANDVSGGEYLFHNSSDTDLDHGRLAWQCGRGPDILAFWTLWKNLGTTGIGEFIDSLIDLRTKLVAWIRTQDRLQLVHEPTFLNVCVRILPPRGAEYEPDWSQRIREFLKTHDLSFVNYFADENGTFLRLILAHPQLQLEQLMYILTLALQYTGEE